MNQQRYRIIFSKSRGQCIVVAETARSHGGASSAPPGGAVLAAPSSTFGLRLCRIAGLMLGAMGLTGGLLASGAAMAQIVADPGAPGRQRPTVVNTANGTLQVNIQTPSAAGVSRNSYSRFDVPNTGVVLNNSRLNTQSQLGGAVQANPWLTAREARVILNEVNSTSPSQLRGFIEVAGSRAEVIIANPAGINVDGGGFINVSRATLTTGTPILNAGNGGSLDGYTVDRGQIGINGAGLDARQTDYAMLIARSVAINAGIWAQQLAVTAGANQVGIDQASMASPLSAAPIGGNGAAPQYGIDVSQLGGMYANKIVLLGTEAGVGVHNAGSIGASAGEVIVTSEGRLENSGGMAAKLALQINAKGDIDNSGSLSAETAITLAGNAVANSGTVAATDSLTVSAAGSLQNSGTLNGQNAIRLSAGSLANQGIINSAGQAEIDIQGAVSNVDGTIQGQRIALSSATAGIDNQRGKITQTAMADLDLTAAALVNTGGGIVGAPAPAADNGNTGSGSDSGSGPGADGGSASPPPTSGSGTGAGNTDGNTPGNTANNAPPPAIVPSGYIRAAGAIGNDGGTITAGGTLAANVAALDNSGGNLNLRALRVDGGGVINRQGGINVTGDLTAGGNAFDNQGGKILVGGHLQGNAGNLDNRSGAIQADRLDLTVAQDLDNTSGSLRQSGSQDMLLKVGGTFDNQDGSLETPGNLALQAASVTGDGGKITALGNLQIDSGDASVRSGAWVSGGNATINTAALDNHAGTIAAGGAAAIHADGVIDNSLGTIQTAANLDLQAAAMLNNDGGVIAAIGAAGNLQAQAAAISNIGGKIVSDGNLDIHAGGAVDNTLGILHGGGNTQLSAGAALTNDNGIIEATGPAGTLGVSAGSIASDGGRIVNIGSGLTSIASAGDIANAGNGVIAGNGAVDVRASSLHNNAGGTIASGADLTLGATQALVNLGTINSSGAFTFDSTGAGFSNGGQIASGGNIVIAANAFDNIGGSIETGQGSASDFSLTSQSMNNALGHIVTDRDLSIRTQQLGTAGGLSSGRDLSLSFNGDALLDGNSQLHANRDLNLTLTGTLTNTSTLAAVNTLTVSAGALDNVAGGIIEAQNIALTMPGVLNNAGQINGAGNVTIAAGEIDNSNSIVGGDLVVSTQNLNNTGAAALIGSTGNMSLWIAGQLNNADGATIYSAGSMAVAGNAARTDGVLVGRTAVINNTGSTIEAAGDLEMAANTVNNIRSGVAVDKVTTVDETTAMHTASWWTNGNNNDVYSPHSSNFDANEIYYVNPADIIEDGTYITPDGYTIGRAVIKTHANDSVFFSGVSSHFNTFGETDRLAGSDGTQVIYYLLKQDNQSNPDQVAGTDGGLETSPGTWNALPSFSTQYGSCSTDCIRLVAQYDYTDPTTTILRSTARYLAPSKEALEASRTAHHVAIDDVLSPTAGTEARIQSGGNMRISVDQALNNQYASIMAGGGLQIDGGTTAAVSNVGETLYRTHTFDGTWYTYGGSAVHYDMPSISEVIGSVGGVMSGNQGVAISGHSFSNVDVSAGTAANIRSSVTVLGSGANGPGLGGSGAAADVGNAAAVSQANGTGATVKVSASGLFEQSQSGDFLFATRSAFTRDNAAAQTSSDFFLNALGIDPNAAQKRIGDGYYEQEMVRDQMAELTGRVTGSANDDSQYKALMTAGVGFAEQWNLTPGIALTADQVAHLTSDIVWMESETVVLPDGTTQTVLAPKVYLAHVDDDAVKTNGALVTGDNVIISAGDIVNKGGLIDGSNGSGDGRTILLAANDISNLGGSIQGDNIALNAGGDIRNETLAVTETHADGQVSDSFTSLSNQATIAAGDSLLIQAGRDVVDIAGQISAGLGKPEGIGDVQISAGRDISLSTVQTGSDYTAHTAGYSDTASSVVHQSSQLAAGGDLTLSAGQDIALSGAQLAIGVNGSGSGVLVAGRDLSVTAVTNQSNIDAGNDSGAKGYNRLTSENQTVVGTHIAASDDLTLKAGAGQTGDLALTGSGVAAGGDVTLAASGDVAIQQAMETHQWDLESHNSSKGFLSSSSSSSSDASNKNLVVGSSVSGNSVSIVAGNDIAIGASQITAQHDLGLVAGHDLTISSAAESDDEKHAHEESKSGFSASLMSGISYGSGSQNQSQTVSSVTQVGSTISGANVSTSSGRDTTITASAVLADQNVSISAGRNIGILAAANQQTSQSDGQSSSTGIGLMPGLSGRFTAYGNNNALQNGNGTDIAQSTSLISANGGNLSMQAGLDKQYDGTGQGNVTTQGAELLAADQLSIAGNAVDLQAIHDSSTSRSHAETHSVTLGSSLTGSIGGAITRIGDMASEAQHTDNGRLQGALALKAGYDAYKLAGSMPATIAAMQSGEPNPISSGEGFGVSVNLGVSQSRQDSNNSGTESRGTTAQAGNISITSREGDIDMQAAKLQAQDIGLDAAKDINLIAAANTADLQSTNSASNAGIGATFGSNGQQTGLSFQIGGSLANGHANGTETTYDNTQISATDHLSVKSGGDVNMIGAQLAGDQVSADIGGNLNIVTLQDGSNFDSKQETGGFSLSLCIPPICVGTTVTGSINYGLQTVDHNYQSAVGQSGIAAGDGGFDLNVKGNTALTGAAITSTAPADKNSLQTASLSSSDLTNTQHTDSESVSIGISTGSIAGNVIHNALGNLNGNAAMPKNGDESSNTNSVISPAQVTITGTGDAATDAQSKANAATLTSRDASTANASLSNTLTLQQAQELQAQLQQQQENQRAADLAGAVLNNVVGDVAQKAGWADGSPEKIVLHGLAGLIEAKIGGSSAVAGVVSGMSVEAMSPILSEYLLSHGYTNDPKDADGYHAYNDMMSLGATLVGAASGALAGGDVQSAGAGGSIGLAADVNNRQLHPSEKELASRLATASNGKYTQAEIEEQMRGMSMTTNGVTEVTSVDTIIDNNLGDGGWMRAGTTIDGQPIYMQQISPEDTALRAYIINNTTNSDVPSLINYGGTYLIPSVSNTPFPIPTANCATAECAAGVLPNKSLTQQELDAMKNGTADFASWSSTQSGRVSAAAIVYATYLSTIPNPAAQAGAGIQAGIAASATLFGLSASAIEQFLRPNVGGMAIDTAGSVLGEIMGRISPIASPITNEIIEQIKNTSEANILKNFINRQAKNE